MSLQNKLVRNTLLRKRCDVLRKKRCLYEKLNEDTQRYSFQLKKLNSMWSYALENVPFYQHWSRKHGLPKLIENVEDLKKFPILNKGIIQENEDLVLQSLRKYRLVTTGGSSGEPMAFPTNKRERDNIYANAYLGRSWWGIEPLDKILLIWGHSHAFGEGKIRIVNNIKRSLSDYIIGTKRLSAYDLSEDNLARYCKEINTGKYVAIIGYTSAIYKLAKYVKENELPLNACKKLKAVIMTSETVTGADIKLVQNTWGVKAVVEYGTAELGIVSYSKNEVSRNCMMWDSHISTIDTNNELIVTTLDNRLLPLINYRTNDIVKPGREYSGSIMELREIVGRSHDLIEIVSDGRKINVHGEIFTHILKSIKGIYSFEIIQKKNKDIDIKYVLRGSGDVQKYFCQLIRKEFPKIELKKFRFVEVDSIEKTIAGKQKWIKVEV